MTRERDDDARIDAADAALTRGFDAELAAAVRRAGRHVTCRRGCTRCCIGVFDMTALDARRLRRGYALLVARRPRAAAAVSARAALQWAAQREGFPGDTATGALGADDEARQRFFAAHAEAPCPVLDPRTGGCALYEFRPLSCRSYGVPLRCGEQVLPPCPLNFTTATVAEVAAATAEPDPGDGEGALLAELRAHDEAAGDTTVAAALANARGRR